MMPAYETAALKNLDGVRVIERDDNSLTMEFSVPDTNPCFDGHFPGFPILPAIAQTELVIRFASHYLGTGIDVSEIPRIKFTNLVRPFAPLVLKMEKKEKTVSFRITSPDNETVYSAGTMKTRDDVFPGKNI